MCYGRQHALDNPWPENVDLCEDWEWLRTKLDVLHSVESNGMIVCGMTNPRPEADDSVNWPPIPIGELPARFRRVVMHD